MRLTEPSLLRGFLVSRVSVIGDIERKCHRTRRHLPSFSTRFGSSFSLKKIPQSKNQKNPPLSSLLSVESALG